MKKILFYLMATICIANIEAQNSIVANAYLTSTGIQDVIIKSYNYPYTITCAFCDFSDPQSYYSIIALNDANHVSHQRPLTGYRVHDFVIDHDTVFFCGESQYGFGVIGFLDINDFFYNWGDFYIQDTIRLIDGNSVANLTDMVTYYGEDGFKHVVSIGYAQDSFIYYTSQNSCIVDMKFENYNMYSYNTGVITKSNPEALKDIELRGNYIVTAGFELGPYISIRLYNKNNIFCSGGIQNTVYVFNIPTGQDTQIWETDDLSIALDGDFDFAIASVFNRYTSPTPNYQRMTQSVHLSKFNKSYLLTNNPNAMTIASQLYAIDDHAVGVDSVFQFVNNWRNGNYGLLFNMTYKDMHSRTFFFELSNRFITCFNHMVAYTGDDFCYDRGYTGLDMYNFSTQYVIGGRCAEDHWEQQFCVETPLNASTCNPKVEYYLNAVPRMEYSTVRIDIEDYGGIGGPTRHNTLSMHNKEINIICEE